jgi:hypothetical protein
MSKTLLLFKTALRSAGFQFLKSVELSPAQKAWPKFMPRDVR